MSKELYLWVIIVTLTSILLNRIYHLYIKDTKNIHFCKNCAYHKEGKCYHLKILKKNPHSLVYIDQNNLMSNDNGVYCVDQREKKLFALCGMKGKLWEPYDI